jgi:tetratricopeptide (TPR) repeat protein
MARAIELDPKNPLYRNNIAATLVDKGRLGDAYKELRAVHGDAESYYNLGFLLNKKGQTQEALRHFQRALQADPSMVMARRWVDYLQQPNPKSGLEQYPTTNGERIASRPPMYGTPGRPSVNDGFGCSTYEGNRTMPSGQSYSPTTGQFYRTPYDQSSATDANGNPLPGISYNQRQSPGLTSQQLQQPAQSPQSPYGSSLQSWPPPRTASSANSVILQPLPPVR